MANKWNAKKLMKTAEECLRDITATAFYVACTSMADIKEDKIWECETEKPEKFLVIERQVENRFNTLIDDSLLSTDALETKIKELQNLKNELIALAKPMDLYYIEANKLYKTGLYYDRIFDCEGIDNNEITDEDIISHCTNYILKTLEGDELFTRIASVLACLPANMAKEKYYDIIYKSFIRECEEMTKGQVICTKKDWIKKFCPASSEHFGEIFTEWKEKINSWHELPFESLTKQELDFELDEIYQLKYEAAGILEYMQHMNMLINYLTIVLIDEDTLEALLTDDIIARDLYLTVKNYAGTEEYALYEDNVTTTSKDKTEKYTQNIGNGLLMLDKHFDKMDDNPESKMLDDIMLKIAVTTMITDIALEDLIFDSYSNNIEDADTIDTAFVKEQAELLITEIKTVSLDYSVKWQKHMRRLFYDDIAVVIKSDDFIQIILQCFSSISRSAEKVAVIESIERITNCSDDDYDDDYDNDDLCDHHHCHE